MPAVNPQRLDRQVGVILNLVEHPQAMVRETLDLLDFYADRTRRPGTATDVEDVVRAFHVPAPVLRRLMLGVAEAIEARGENFKDAADLLWDADYRETMLMASAALSTQSGRAAADWAEAHAVGCQDRLVLEHLGRHGLEGWRRSDERAFLQAVEDWLNRKPALQMLALQAMRGAVEDGAFKGLPRVFQALEGCAGRMRGARWKAFEQLVRALAQRSPQETTRFAMEALKRDDPGAKKMARSLLDALPMPLQARISQFLSR
jgi:hypothetical protein